MKVAFLDRDGTIIGDYPDEEWKDKIQPVFLEGSFHAMKEILKKGYEIIIVTNQYIIGEGIISLDRYEEFTDNLKCNFVENGVKILDILFCPHSRNAGCDCCKPRDGMIKTALKKYPGIEMDKSFIAGDSSYDIELGNNLGIKTFGINIKNNRLSYIRVHNLSEIVKYI